MRLVVALAFLLIASPAWGAAAFVQAKASQLATGNPPTIDVTLNASVGSGNGLCGMVTHGATDTAVTVSDDKGNTYTIVRDLGSAIRATTFYLTNITNAPTTITATPNDSTLYIQIVVIEMSGVKTSAALDVETGQLQSSPGTSTDAITSGAVTTAENGEFVCGFSAVTDNLQSNTYTAGTNFTERAEGGNGSSGVDAVGESLVQTSAGSIAATFTQSTTNSTATFIMTFKAAAAASSIRHKSSQQ